jgi:hypothetical protein
MVAIAQRESSLNPSCLATSVAGSTEASYGLWQINMYGPLGAQRLAQFGITDPTQLLDPATNARAAYALWGGNDANLNTAWMINTNTATIPYATLYQNNLNNLPSNLESTYGGSDSGSNSASSSSDTSVGNILDSASAGDLTSIGVLAGAGFALLYLLFGR